jgi:hypothetical protein
VFVALERRGNRVRCEQGWASILAKSGNVLLEELPIERTRTTTHLLQPSPRSAEEEPSRELELSPPSPRALAAMNELAPSLQVPIQPRFAIQSVASSQDSTEKHGKTDHCDENPMLS